eukprot:g23373.t1
MPVPTEMPSSPTIAVRTAASKVDVSTGEPTQFSGIAMHSSAMVSSALALSPSDLPVPTDLPSPTSIACAARRSADMQDVDERSWVKAFWDNKLDGVA